jgi:orotidine-5'-phosphate decarboxylase|uniref:Orotidine 5'-phosphate decarboxylase n=1 Tax=candidate division WOR-3 bacterium TaxID=2052148 RepID=A0A7C6A940_UNCW3
MTQLILAVNVDSLPKAKRLYRRTQGWIDVYKVGIDLFCRTGTRAVKLFTDLDARVFLDLKFNDIPSVVAQSALAVTKMGVDMFTIHTTGGVQMMRETVETVHEFCNKKRLKKRPLILGVTVLTSLDEKSLAVVSGHKKPVPVLDRVVELALLAKKVGLDGVVASALEVTEIKKACGKDFIVVCPGIRLPEEAPVSGIKDQLRVVTPGEAARRGADYIVLGRPIIQALDPVTILEQVKKEIEAKKN